jgi:hypothetical protein
MLLGSKGLRRRVTAPLSSNRRPIVARVDFTGMCLLSRLLAMGIHVTI